MFGCEGRGGDVGSGLGILLSFFFEVRLRVAKWRHGFLGEGYN